MFVNLPKYFVRQFVIFWKKVRGFIMCSSRASACLSQILAPDRRHARQRSDHMGARTYRSSSGRRTDVVCVYHLFSLLSCSLAPGCGREKRVLSFFCARTLSGWPGVSFPVLAPTENHQSRSSEDMSRDGGARWSRAKFKRVFGLFRFALRDGRRCIRRSASPHHPRWWGGRRLVFHPFIRWILRTSHHLKGGR